jgi:uncharacterized membrane protein YcaP (DUF421 family)
METLNYLLGLESDQLTALQMMVRAFVVFFVLLLLIRLTGIRTLGKHSAFDHLTLLIVGAVMGRVIVVGEQSFFGTLFATGVIILLHRLISWLTLAYPKLENLFKGKKVLLAKSNKLQTENLKKAGVTPEDIRKPCARKSIQINWRR